MKSTKEGGSRDNPLWLSLAEQDIGQARGPVPTLLAALFVIPVSEPTKDGLLKKP